MKKPIATLAVFLALVCGVAFSASASQWKSRTIYQVLTDRFATTGGSSECSDLHSYCGGSFDGIIAQLDYIQGMGFDAVWISPVVENTDEGYHGYWAKDLDKISPNFGGEEGLKALSEALHERGMYLMVDVVANHMGPVGDDYSELNPFNKSSHFHDCSGCPSSCNIENFGDQAEVEHCRLSGLPDLNQDSNDFVAKTLLSWIKNLVKTYQIDGIRIDTVPEVSKKFWSQFQSAAGVYAIGEAFNSDVDYVSSYQPTLNGVLSYPLYETLRNCFAKKESLHELESQLQAYDEKFSDPTLLGTFIDNHDNVRFLHEQEDRALYLNAILYVLTGKGIPIVYYGTEQEFGGGDDPENREDLWRSGYNTGAEIYAFIAQVNAYKKKASLWNTPQVQRYADDEFYAFTRGNTLVVLTNGGSDQSTLTRTITYHPYRDGTKLCNLFDRSNDCVTVKDGKFDVTVGEGKPKVYYP